MIRDCKKFDESIEINIFRGPILEVMKNDNRIRQDIVRDMVGNASGHALLPEELHNGHKDKKICYCKHSQKSFNDTIITVFHEIYHFYTPFSNIGENIMRKVQNNINLDQNLRYNVVVLLSEFFVRYKFVNKLSSQSQFKKFIMDKVENCLRFLKDEEKYSNERNKRFKNLNPIKLMDKIIVHKFSNLFNLMGFWRGFNKTNIKFSFQDGWKKYILRAQDDDILELDFLDYLKKKLLKEQIKILEDNIFRRFEQYFRIIPNFQI